MNKLFEAIGHPPFILWLSVFLFATFFLWSYTGFDSLFYEIFHILLAIVTLIIALVIEGSEKADTKAIQYKLDEIIKAMPQIANEKAGLELELKTGKSLDEVIKKVDKITKRRNK
ncbi:MAG: low affinity iron permease family protein [Candidatus Levybacteria bacterium]|nr:low affinity iron permease family protein [Candidatus Levybacteria bacterium]